MRLSFIIFSLFFCFSSLASDWKSPAEALLSQEGNEEKFQSELQSIKDLDMQLTKALDKEGRDEQLALNTIRKIQRLSMVDTLMKKVEKMDIHSERAATYLVTLLSLNNSSRGKDIMTFASRKIDLTSNKFSSSLRIALLSAMYSREEMPPMKVMNELLDDFSFELRLKAMDVALASADKNPSAVEPFLKKALHVSPYPIRLKALEQIKLFPKDLKSHYKQDIVTCAKSDPDENVRSECKSFRF